MSLHNPYCLVFEGLIDALFAGAVWHARRNGRFQLLELTWAALYGFVLEWLTLKQLHAYHYGQFAIMIDGAPVAIALGWAVVIYSTMNFSPHMQLPEPARPILDALLALNIDLALDAVAIRLGMWAWTDVGLNQQWFGVPWANFMAWFVIVWSYSGFVRALRPWQDDRWRQWLYAPFAALLSLLCLVSASELYRFMAENGGGIDVGVLTSLFLIGGSLVIVLTLRPRLLQGGSLDPILTVIPAVFHGFALITGIVSGIFGEQPVLAIVGLTMLALGLCVHLWPWWVNRPY